AIEFSYRMQPWLLLLTVKNNAFNTFSTVCCARNAALKCLPALNICLASSISSLAASSQSS
ncbi:MAG: hypothetical protein QXP69_05040, partial [Candidatus Nitrosocaldus sp.]